MAKQVLEQGVLLYVHKSIPDDIAGQVHMEVRKANIFFPVFRLYLRLLS